MEQLVMLIYCDIPFSENIPPPLPPCVLALFEWLKETALKAGGESGADEDETVPGSRSDTDGSRASAGGREAIPSAVSSSGLRLCGQTAGMYSM